MKATILLGTLKKSGLSNTETLSEFLSGRLEKQGIACERGKLVDYDISPGRYSHMGAGDDWPETLAKVLDSDILILATPIWWNHHLSLI